MFDSDVIYRLPLYIVFGIVNEFLFTAIADLIHPGFVKSWNVFGATPTKEQPSWRVPGRDTRAVGYSFLWMIPIYMLLAFLEPMQQVTGDWPWWLRGTVYVLMLWVVEFTMGALIQKISGRDPWDYSMSKFQFKGHIRWDFFPLWFAFMLTAEWMSGKFVALTPAIKEVFFP